MCIYSAFLLVSLHIMVEKMMGIITLCFIASTLFATGCSKSTNHREVRVSISKEDTQEKAIWNGKTIEIDEDNNNIIYTDCLLYTSIFFFKMFETAGIELIDIVMNQMYLKNITLWASIYIISIVIWFLSLKIAEEMCIRDRKKEFYLSLIPLKVLE